MTAVERLNRIEDAVRDVDRWIDRLIREWPPLTIEQRDKLGILLSNDNKEDKP